MNIYFASLFNILIFQMIPEEAQLWMPEKKKQNQRKKDRKKEITGCAVMGYSQNSKAVINSRLAERLHPEM
jgi:hypothetical protein